MTDSSVMGPKWTKGTGPSVTRSPLPQLTSDTRAKARANNTMNQSFRRFRCCERYNWIIVCKNHLQETSSEQDRVAGKGLDGDLHSIHLVTTPTKISLNTPLDTLPWLQLFLNNNYIIVLLTALCPSHIPETSVTTIRRDNDHVCDCGWTAASPPDCLYRNAML